MATIKGKTKSGFAWKVDDAALTGSYRFVRLNAQLARAGKTGDDAGTVTAADALLDLVLGASQVEALITHLEKKGDASPKAVFDEYREILDAVKEKSTAVKN